MKEKTVKATILSIKRIFAAFMCLLTVIMMVPTSTIAETNNNEKRVVRVGWHEPPYFIKDENGRCSGYSYEYLQKVAAYTGWEFEYVEGSWFELLQKLKDGEIDLMSNVSYTDERAKDMLYSSIPMGTESYYIFVSTENEDITSENLSSLNGKRVGVTKDSFQEECFIEWAKKHNIECQLIETTGTDEESMKGLDTEYDAFVSIDVYGTFENLVPLCKVGSSDFYFTVAKGKTDILSELDFALSSIQDENKYYDQQLHDKYLKGNESNLFLSKSEIEWLENHKTIKIGYQDNYLAFCAKDKNSGELIGALKDYLDYASQSFKNGEIEFEATSYNTAADLVEALKNGDIDCMFPANLTDYDAEELGFVKSAPVMTTEMEAIVRLSQKKKFLKKENIVCAVNEGNTNYDSFLTKEFPTWDRIYYKDTSACLDAVANKNADCVVISNYRYSNVSRQCEKLHLAVVDLGITLEYCFATRKGETQLYSIIGKMINDVPESAMHTSLTYYSTREAKLSLLDVIIDNWGAIMAVVIVILLVIVILMLKNIMADVRTKKKIEEQRRITDDLSRRVFVDALTHLRNKGGYDEYIKGLKERVEKGEVKEFAVVMCDCDNLKSINDKYGHEKGDEYIKAATSVICEVFRHSPVFRVGGDEFTAILQNDDFNNRERLLEKFEEKCKEIKETVDNEWMHVNVSIGMAEYNSALDDGVEDTAKRADNKMYENKRARKAGRNNR